MPDHIFDPDVLAYSAQPPKLPLDYIQPDGKRPYAGLVAFHEPVTLATDSLAWDWPWIPEIFYDRTWPDNVSRTPGIVGQTPEFASAVEAAATSHRQHRRHALDDAKANRLAWLAINTR